MADNVAGLQNAMRSLQTIAANVRAKAVRRAVRAGATIIKAQMRANAERIADTGATGRSIDQREKTYNRGDIGTAVVGPRKDYQEPALNAEGAQRTNDKGEPMYHVPNNYSHLVEFGTEHSPPKPFIRPAYDTKGREAVAAMESNLWESIVAGLQR